MEKLNATEEINFHYRPRAKYYTPYWGFCPWCGSYFSYFGNTGTHKPNCYLEKKINEFATAPYKVMPLEATEKAFNSLGLPLSSVGQLEGMVRRRFELYKGLKLIRRGEDWTAEVKDWNFANNTIEMEVKNKIGNGWIETWNLEHTLVGLQRGDYRYAT